MNRSLKIITTLGACAGIVLSIALSPFRVFADDPEPKNLTFSFEIKGEEEKARFSIVALGAVETPGENPEDPPEVHEVELEPGEVGVRLVLSDTESTETDEHGDPRGVFLEPEFTSGAEKQVPMDRIEATCSSEFSCTVTIKNVVDDEGFRFATPGGSPFAIRYSDGSDYYASAANLTESADFEIVLAEARVEFDGKAYVAWECEDGGTCLGLLENLTIPEDGVDRTDVKYDYISAGSIVDPRTEETFNNFEDEKTRGFFLPEALENWVEKYKEVKGLASFDMINSWETVEISDLLSGTDMHEIERDLIDRGICEEPREPGELEACVDRYVEENDIKILNGIRLRGDGPVEKSSYMTTGDNMFNVIIYSDTYAAVTAVNIDDLDYIPYGFGVDPVDLTGSTEDSSAVLTMPLLDNRIYIDSTKINDYEIESVEVLDKNISENAVVISQNQDGSFLINFSSNFFDDVIFKITGSDGETYYLQIFRLTLTETVLDHGNDFNNHFTGVRAELIFDEETSWDDYELTATIIYADGSSLYVPLENLGWVDDNYGGNLQFTKEYKGELSGKGLKRANFGYAFDDRDFDRDIRKVYFNVRFAGSTEERYAGTFSGSGRGTLLEVESRY